MSLGNSELRGKNTAPNYGARQIQSKNMLGLASQAQTSPNAKRFWVIVTTEYRRLIATTLNMEIKSVHDTDHYR